MKMIQIELERKFATMIFCVTASVLMIYGFSYLLRQLSSGLLHYRPCMTLLMSVHAFVRAGDRKPFDLSKTVSFSALLNTEVTVTVDSPLTWLAMALNATKVSYFKGQRGRI